MTGNVTNATQPLPRIKSLQIYFSLKYDQFILHYSPDGEYLIVVTPYMPREYRKWLFIRDKARWHFVTYKKYRRYVIGYRVVEKIDIEGDYTNAAEAVMAKVVMSFAHSAMLFSIERKHVYTKHYADYTVDRLVLMHDATEKDVVIPLILLMEALNVESLHMAIPKDEYHELLKRTKLAQFYGPTILDVTTSRYGRKHFLLTKKLLEQYLRHLEDLEKLDQIMKQIEQKTKNIL